MKKLNLLFIALLITIFSLGQDEVLTPTEEIIGNTFYDLQSWRTMQNRIFYYDDGTIGAVWNMGMNFPNFPDLGIGYNYYDGDEWGVYPVQSITSGWAINPSYTAYLENGEMCVSQGNDGLIISAREEKGTGNWAEGYYPGTGYKHPVVVTSGVDHSVIQLLYLDADESFSSTNAQPFRGFIRYSRSADGGQTWDPSNILLDGLGSDKYLGFTIGSYTWAEPKGDVIAFVAGDYLTDLVLMKSPDGGNTWQKTIIWEHPYPFFEIFTFESDTFYCNGGGMTVTLDNDNMAHIAFGLSRVFSTTAQDTLWYDPYADGIAYWREDMPGFKNTMNSLHPDSLSICDNLIGWSSDINANGTLDILPPGFYPALGLSTYPSLVIDDLEQMFLVFSSVTETYNNGVENYRHLWARPSPDLGCSWGNFVDLTSDLIHIFDECVYSSVAPYIDDHMQLVYQIDNEPGLAIVEDPYSENYITHMEIDLWWETENIGEKGIYVDFRINQDSIFEGDTVNFQNLSCGCPFPYSFNWEFEGGVPGVSIEINPSIVYPNAGTYDVSLLADNGSSLTEYKADYITVYPLTSVADIHHTKSISISPNPSKGIFYINLSHYERGEIRVEIYNILGKKVMQTKHLNKESQSIVIDLTDNDDGIYFIKIESGSATITKKIAVQH
ncbi:MAG: T9SS type A sorting domain-containing protein [Bacteroidales bacterium]|nr:T9SS type A sorting domain-containing protein [Bacteroidales bacterium]